MKGDEKVSQGSYPGTFFIARKWRRVIK